MSAYTPPSLDKELRVIAIRGSTLLRVCTRQLPRGAVAAATKAVLPPFLPPLHLLPPFHLPSPNAVLLPLIAKTDPTRGLQPRESLCGIYYEAASAAAAAVAF